MRSDLERMGIAATLAVLAVSPLAATRALGPAIPAADRAIETADLKPVSALLEKAMSAGLAERFHRLVEAKRHAGTGVEAGRRYVAAYVEFIHYVERLHEGAVGLARGHGEEPAAGAGHAH